MAEFCLECWNRINKTNYGKGRLVLSRDYDLCEGCGKWKKVVEYDKHYYNYGLYRYDMIGIRIIWKIIKTIIVLPYKIYKIFKTHRKNK